MRTPTQTMIRDAATVVLTRDSGAGRQVLMLRRSPQSPAFPGFWVFPGGTVDTADGTDDPLRVAAVREVREECGVTLSPDLLTPISLWEPPESARHRFRTTFFQASAPEAEVVTDDFEIVDHRWVTPEEALEHHAASAWDFLPPTWVTLATLNEGSSPAVQGGLPLRQFFSHVVSADPTVLAWGGDEAHPTQAGPAGSRHRITMGERPWAYESSGAAAETEKEEAV